MIKCIECGTEFDDSLKACPSCGCPVQDAPETHGGAEDSISAITSAVQNQLKDFQFNLFALAALIMGVVILIMGFNLRGKQFDIDVYKAAKYSVDYAAFGGDFQTEIYNASDTAVDAISAVNGGIASLSTSISDFAEVIAYSAGTIIIAIGIGIIAVSVLYIKKESAR